MTQLEELRRTLRALPDPPAAPDPDADPVVGPAVAASVGYLSSDGALASLDADVYWPKWSSPWWHMLLLFEMGEARRIPGRAVAHMVERLDAFPLKIFPIWPGELPEGASPSRDVLCHCALGSIVQVLAACGVDVDRALPWIEGWFARYQMADGGLNCDEAAYRVEHECPSSMVGTVAPLEAMLLGDPRTWSAARAAFVARAAGFLIGRRLVEGSRTAHNAEERDSAAGWLAPCFPRFYYYDVVRGLAALVRWAEVTGGALPLDACAGVVAHLARAFPDGAVVLGREAFAGLGTWAQAPSGAWVRLPLAHRAALLDATCAVGSPSPYVSRQWADARRGLLALIERGAVTA